ncbi:uncharacterized protein V1516DRAFT_695980 [Lipomyces oligophaga]|uniref:uncharacterized protein n=1 Tax=Lipomyces oligophaga TaxID=45792 RepID=UPI0034CD2E1A
MDIPAYAPASDSENEENDKIQSASTPITPSVKAEEPIITGSESQNDNEVTQSSEDASESSESGSETEVPETLIPIPTRRLPKDLIGKLEERIQRDGPRTKLIVYSDLISEYLRKGKLESARLTYERSLKTYPTMASQWVSYADMELNAGEFARAEEVFKRAVESVTSLAIWQQYLNYVRRRNVLSGSESDTSRKVITQAFELVLSKVGIDVRAGNIWKDYLEFLKSAPEGNSTWESQQKMDTLRRVYQRVLCIPVDNLELLWQDYNTFENSISKAGARKLLQDRSPAYMTARTCLRDLHQLSGQLNRQIIPVRPQWKPSDSLNLDAWLKWISWEKKDPLGFTAEDGKSGMPGGPEQVIERVIYAYKQSLQPLRFYPQVHFDYSEYCASVNRTEDQLAALKEGVSANPDSCLLNFRLAEVYEVTKRIEEAKEVYESFAASILKDIETVEKRGNERKKSAMDSSTTRVNGGGSIPNGEEHVSHVPQLVQQQQQKIAEIESKTQRQVSILAKDLTLCNTMFMRAIKRMEGHQAARKVFGEARRGQYATYHIFVASALMEYHHNKDTTIANKIFDLGLKRFSDNVAFVEQYLDFLLMTNDDINARALFERTVSKVSSEDAKLLFTKFYAYEAAYGSEISAVSKLESRMLELYPETQPISLFAKRYTLGGHSILSEREVGPEIFSAFANAVESSSSYGRDILSDDDSDEDEEAKMATSSRNRKLSNRTLKRLRESERRGGAAGETRKRSKKREKKSPHRLPLSPSGLSETLLHFLALLPQASSYNAVWFSTDQVMNLLETTRIPSVPPPRADRSRFRRA